MNVTVDEQGVPHRAEDATTVKVGGFSLLVDEDGLNCPPP